MTLVILHIRNSRFHPHTFLLVYKMLQVSFPFTDTDASNTRYVLFIYLYKFDNCNNSNNIHKKQLNYHNSINVSTVYKRYSWYHYWKSHYFLTDRFHQHFNSSGCSLSFSSSENWSTSTPTW